MDNKQIAETSALLIIMMIGWIMVVVLSSVYFYRAGVEEGKQQCKQVLRGK